MITTEELKVKLAEYGTAVKDLEEALAIEASRKRVQELEHTMSRPGFYDDAELSKKVFDEVGDLRVDEAGPNQPTLISAAPHTTSELMEAMTGRGVDAPLCLTCGTKMRPSGSCYVCEGCGSTSGCS